MRCEHWAGGRIKGTKFNKWSARKRGGIWWLFKPYEHVPIEHFQSFEEMRTWRR